MLVRQEEEKETKTNKEKKRDNAWLGGVNLMLATLV